MATTSIGSDNGSIRLDGASLVTSVEAGHRHGERGNCFAHADAQHMLEDYQADCGAGEDGNDHAVHHAADHSGPPIRRHSSRASPSNASPVALGFLSR